MKTFERQTSDSVKPSVPSDRASRSRKMPITDVTGRRATMVLQRPKLAGLEAALRDRLLLAERSRPIFANERPVSTRLPTFRWSCRVVTPQ